MRKASLFASETCGCRILLISFYVLLFKLYLTFLISESFDSHIVHAMRTNFFPNNVVVAYPCPQCSLSSSHKSSYYSSQRFRNLSSRVESRS
ncbi:hypothetical protein BDR03DRAFT_261769 [Suillus americanus]|nr:hypothetical protein BDR03DRAFT_261769 [Suillus americanus]